MKLYNFTIELDREYFPENYIDQLYDAGLDDALVCEHDNEVSIVISREAETLAKALNSAVENILKVTKEVSND
jgi:hypothetical protein